VPKATEVVAWWGAVLSTTVFLWDIYKWQTSGPKLRVTIKPNMETINVPEYDGKKLLIFEVANCGDRPTTITNILFVRYNSTWARLRQRASNTFFIKNPNPRQPLPCEIKPGNIWTGLGIQGDELEGRARSGQMFCVVLHSHRKRHFKQRILISECQNGVVRT
jgi:hypothetical protein